MQLVSVMAAHVWKQNHEWRCEVGIETAEGEGEEEGDLGS